MARTLLLIAILGLLTGAAPVGPTARLAIVIGVNRVDEPGKAPLRYADDDAARYFDLFRLLGAQTYLLTRLDPNTQRVHPQATVEAAAPRRAELDRIVATAARQAATGRRRGVRTVLYFLFAGHADIRQGEGYLGLEDGRLTASMLRDRVIRRVGADETHVIVDACHSYFIASARGPGGKRRPVRGFVDASRSALGESVGLLLSTSAAQLSHEWEGFQAGVFSHAVRSGLYGAADADGDGLVTYREIAAFVERANAAIPNERFRSRVYARHPQGMGTLVDLRGQADRLLTVDPEHHGRYLLEDLRGVRLVDFHSGAGQQVRLLRPGSGPLYLRRLPDGVEYPVPPSDGPVRLAALTPRDPRSATRGAAHHAFSQLFSLPFDRQVVAAFSLPEEVVASAPDTGVAPPGRTRWRRVAGWTALGVGAASLASAVALSLSAHHLSDSVPADEPQLDRVQRNQAIDRRNTGAVVMYSVAGASAVAGVLLLLWPDGPLATASAGPGSVNVALGGRF